MRSVPLAKVLINSVISRKILFLLRSNVFFKNVAQSLLDAVIALLLETRVTWYFLYHTWHWLKTLSSFTVRKSCSNSSLSLSLHKSLAYRHLLPMKHLVKAVTQKTSLLSSFKFHFDFDVTKYMWNIGGSFGWLKLSHKEDHLVKPSNCFLVPC